MRKIHLLHDDFVMALKDDFVMALKDIKDFAWISRWKSLVSRKMKISVYKSDEKNARKQYT